MNDLFCLYASFTTKSTCHFFTATLPCPKRTYRDGIKSRLKPLKNPNIESWFQCGP